MRDQPQAVGGVATVAGVAEGVEPNQQVPTPSREGNIGADVARSSGVRQTGAGPMLAEEYPLDVVPILELMLAFEVAKNALVQAKERAQQAMAALLSAARLVQDELLRLEALAAKGQWGLRILQNVAHLMRMRGEAAIREADELDDLH